MKTTDSDYDKKRQKFIECSRRAENCQRDDCDGCEYNLSIGDFTHFAQYGTIGGYNDTRREDSSTR